MKQPKPEPDETTRLGQLLTTPLAADALAQDLKVLLIQKGAILSLVENGSEAAVATLKEAVQRSDAPEIQQKALWALGELADRQPVAVSQALFELAIEDAQPEAARILGQRGLNVDPARQVVLALFYDTSRLTQLDAQLHLLTQYMLQTPEDTLRSIVLAQAERAGFKNWGLILKASLAPGEAELRLVLDKFALFTGDEKKLTLDLLKSPAQAGNLSVQWCLCQLFIRHEYLPARDLALSAGFQPGDHLQAALFYFLAEQWEKYTAIDFDFSALTTAYEISSRPIQDRLIALSRSSGQMDWTRRLTSVSRRTWLGNLTAADWDSILQSLEKDAHWTDLWRLAQSAPPAWAANILVQLDTAGWKPEEQDENEAFQKLASLARFCLKASLPISPRQVWHSPSQEITCLGFGADSKLLAAGTSQTSIHLWKLTATAEPQQAIFSPAARSQSLAIIPGGQYLAAAGGDNVIRLFDLAGGRLIKTISGHQGMIKTLATQADGKVLFSASFDHSIQSWRIPQGSALPLHLKLDGEVFGLAVSEDGHFLIAGGAGQSVQVFQLPEGRMLHSQAVKTGYMTALAASSSANQVAFYTRDQQITLMNFASGKRLFGFSSGRPLTFLCFDSSSHFLFATGLAGEVVLFETSTGRSRILPPVHRATIVGIQLIDDGQGLLTGSQDGLLCWWDLRLWKILQIPLEQVSGQPDILKAIREKHEKPENEAAWENLTTGFLALRRRFDIQIGEERTILKVGEYDIEL